MTASQPVPTGPVSTQKPRGQPQPCLLLPPEPTRAPTVGRGPWARILSLAPGDWGSATHGHILVMSVKMPDQGTGCLCTRAPLALPRPTLADEESRPKPG